MATIDAFIEWAGRNTVVERIRPMSLKRLRQPGRAAASSRQVSFERALILAIVIVVHLLLLLELSVAMRPPDVVQTQIETPFEIAIIERHAPAIMRRPVATVAPRVQPAPAPLPNITERPQALQAVTIVRKAASAKPQTATLAPHLLIFDANGAPLIPESATTPSQTRDLLAHRSVSFMLPGGARPHSVDLHVRAGVSPEQVVNTAGRVLSGLLANAAQVSGDPNGVVTIAADRGLRMSGRDTDPCDDIALDAVDLNADSKARDAAIQRQQDSCEGH